MIANTDEKNLDNVIDEMVDAVEKSKDEIFTISEGARKEHELLLRELQMTIEKVHSFIEGGDQLERKVQLSKQRLSQVNKYFDRYSEDEIKEVYENTHGLQTQLAMMRTEEKNLRQKRDELERRLINLDHTIERAEGLAGKVSVVLNYLNDDFRKVNDMLTEAQEKEAFGLKIIEAQEEERRKISREIHDGPAQMLANILLRSEIVDRTFRSGRPEEALLEIKSVRKMIRSSLYEVRRIIYDLRPMALDDLGLIPTLTKYLSTTEDYNNVEIEFSTFGEESRLNSKYEVAFFRLIQEGVQNAIKHAEPTLIKVKLEIHKQCLNVSIQDNGKGFDPAIKREKSFGLIGMKERVEMFDGTLQIDSAIGRGTTIRIQVPYV
ncbi:sensor histidine kinase [Virgibacillus halophilus]|uniref:sensor histidine kinase n=1 Tax=Tigheibacillus halophilus TaxID=361280 RepID=UPI00362E9002